MFKKYGLYVIIAALVFGGLLGLTRSCNLSNRLATVLTEYEVYKAIVKADKQLTDKSLKDSLASLEARDKEIKASVARTHGLEKKLVKKEGVLNRLQGKYDEITTCPEKVESLESQLLIWSDKFTLAESVIVEKDKIIFSLKDKYSTAMGIADMYKAMHMKELDLRVLCEKKANVLERKYRSQRFKGTLKTAVIGVAVGVIAYQIIDK